MKKIVPRREGSAAITSSMPSDPMILSCVIYTDPLCPAPLTSSAMRPPDSQTSSVSLVEIEETPQIIERGPDAERDMQMEHSSLVVGLKCRSRAHRSNKLY